MRLEGSYASALEKGVNTDSEMLYSQSDVDESFK